METYLQDGYYLSVYSGIDSLCNIIGISHRHDHNMSLWGKKGHNISLIHHWEFERITGIKHHDISFFDKHDLLLFINQLLAQYSLTLNDMKAVFGTPGISTIDDYYDIEASSTYTYHAISHLFSSIMIESDVFYNGNIIALAIDGGPDSLLDKCARMKNMYIGAISKKGKIQYFSTPSPALYWAQARNKFNMEEGTLMALAYASESRSLDIVPNSNDVIEVVSDMDKSKVIRYVDEITDKIFSYSNSDEGVKFNFYDPKFTEEDNKISMVMKVIQEMSILLIDKIIDDVIRRYNIVPWETYISLSGGYALNCPTNTHLMHKYNFKGQLIPPFVNDGGQSIGICLYFFYKKMDHFNFRMQSSFYGDWDKNLDEIIKDENYNNFIENVEYSMDKVASDIMNNPVVWFDDRAETGPRALGHRSILADPRRSESKNLLNIYKKRQLWRPVAPIVLEEYMDEWFENSFKSPYMLNNFIVKEDKRSLIPAILHLDNTARVQSVSKLDDCNLHNVLTKFYLETKVPVICNTSLNDKGEPIVNTITQAFNFALRKGFNIIYINGNRISLKNHDKFLDKHPEKRNDELFRKYRNDENNRKEINLFNFTANEYLFYINNAQLHNLDINNKADVKKIKRVYAKLRGKYPNMRIFS